MIRRSGMAALLVVLLVGPVAAQPASYADLATRPIKSLSDQQLADLRAGRGMGLALVAEVNGYPGPAHVLELADQLGLTADQRARVRAQQDAMRSEAAAIGARLISQEAELERLFTSSVVTEERLRAATMAIGQSQAALRLAHLRTHLATTSALKPEQIRLYAVLRGSAVAAPAPPHKH